jgi:hypothetical protein
LPGNKYEAMGRIEYRMWRVRWCPREDSNLHDLAITRP